MTVGVRIYNKKLYLFTPYVSETLLVENSNQKMNRRRHTWVPCLARISLVPISLAGFFKYRPFLG